MRERRGLLMAVVLLLLAWPAAAQADVYVIRDVSVDESAGTAEEARSAAIAKAQSEAWNRLMLRLVVPAEQGRVPRPTGREFDNLVQSLEISDERLTASSYKARVTVRFRRDAVQGLLRSSGIAHAEDPSPVLLVLPVMGEGSDAVLWSDANPWLRAWQRQASGGKVIDVLVPFADLEDMGAIDAQQAAAGDWAAMQRIMARYQADGVLVARATGSDAAMTFDVDWYEGPQGRSVGVDPVTGSGDAAWAAAVDAVRRGVDAQWSAVSTVPVGPEDSLIADISVRDLAEWLDIRRRLDRPAAVLEAQPLVIGAGRVRVMLRYVGALEQLQAGLRQSGLALQQQGMTWIILPL